MVFPPVTRITPEEEDDILARANIINMLKLSESSKEYGELMGQVAAAQQHLDNLRRECVTRDKACEELQLKCEEAKDKIESFHIEDLVAIKADLKSKITEMETVYDKGYCIVSVPSESGPASTLVITDGRFRGVARELKALGRTFKGEALADSRVTFADLRKIPKVLRQVQPNVHGLRVDFTTLVPLQNDGFALLVLQRDKIKLLDNITEAPELELFAYNTHGTGLIYYGTFIGRWVWYAWKDLVTGWLPELFEDETEGSGSGNSAWREELQLHWSDRRDDLRFCVLEYKSFNAEYLAKINSFFAKRAREQSKPATASKRSTSSSGLRTHRVSQRLTAISSLAPK